VRPIGNGEEGLHSRSDGLFGKLAGSGAAITGSTGKMIYQFAQTANADCADAVADEGVIALPCSSTYSLAASRRASLLI
jgi:hypothetical protein